jgi:hypothetical protein
MIPEKQSSNQQQVDATPKHESITGVLERLTYYSEESGYTVARLPAAIPLWGCQGHRVSVDWFGTNVNQGRTVAHPEMPIAM